MTGRAALLAAIVACGGQKPTPTVPPAPSASASASNSSTGAGPADAGPSNGGVGRIDPEAVRRIVRAASPHFLLCYAPGLRKKHDLAGRVETRFVIDETGHVISAEDVTHGNVLPDDAVRACIVSKFRSLEFPPPQPSGQVPITYPLLLDPSMVQLGSAPDAGAGGGESHTEAIHEPRRFDAAGASGVVGNVDLKSCGHAGGFHGAGHVKITFDPSGRVSKVEVDAPATAGKTAAGACVVKAFAAAHVPGFDGSAVTVGRSIRVP